MLRFALVTMMLLATYRSSMGQVARGEDFDKIRRDQLARLKAFVLDSILPNGLVRDALPTDPQQEPSHPASPDAAGFALVGLCGLHHAGICPEADKLIERILSAHLGDAQGVSPARSADGHFSHFLSVLDGAAGEGKWRDAYSPISSALLVAGAKFASRHFSDSKSIAALVQRLTASVNFNAAINPKLDGTIFLDMTAGGGGDPRRLTRPWNEFTLVVSHALREQNNRRALAIRRFWFDPQRLLKQSYAAEETLTDFAGEFRAAFLVQQGHFLNGDFRLNPSLERFYTSQYNADQQYCRAKSGLNQVYRYGLTAGPVPGVGRDLYHADRIEKHPGKVFSPEAVAAWGDLETLLRFHADQTAASDPRYRYGLLRVSAENSKWVPSTVAMVDHLFLLFGLVESIEPQFFIQRLGPPLAP